MSLRVFHILFISLATVGAFGGATLLWNLSATLEGARLWAAASFVSGIALLIYGGWFLAKIEKLDTAKKEPQDKP